MENSTTTYRSYLLRLWCETNNVSVGRVLIKNVQTEDRLTDLICPRDLGTSVSYTYVQFATVTGFSAWVSYAPRDDNDKFDIKYCLSMHTGDLNEDGLADLICPYNAENGVNATWVQMTTESGYLSWAEFSPEADTTVFDNRQCMTMQAGDVNGDQQTDLICPYDYTPWVNASTTTFVQYGSPTGFTAWQAASPNNPVNTFSLSACSPLHVGDVNGDQLTDLICPYLGAATNVQLSTGNGFSAWTQYGPVYTHYDANLDISNCKNLLVGELNGDNLTDIICPYDYGNGSNATFVQTTVGNTYFQLSPYSPVQPPNTFELTQCNTIQAGDINGDGATDLICPYDYLNGGTTTFVQMGSLTGGFSAWQQAGPASPANTFDLNKCLSMRIGDVTGDGGADLICPYQYDNDETITFVQMSTYAYNNFLPNIVNGN